MANLQHIKGSRTKVLNTFPTKTLGNDGDIVISRISGKGVFLCSKAGGMWYAANKMQELNKLEKTSIRDLTTNKLTVSKMINTENSPDKFVVNDSGNIKYMTGEQVVGDLPLPVNNIAYKTAYCSLGQYSNKDTCEASGGTWYYSENDSHDSISSTAENQLLTVGQYIVGVDAEPTLTYDGSTLEIKRNTDFDDNWQTSTQDALLKFSTPDWNATMDIGPTGGFSINSPRNMTLDSGSDILIDAAGGDVTITSANLSIAATKKLYLDGGTDTYIYEATADVMRIIVGNDILMELSEKGDDGNEVNFGSSCVGFTQLEPTYDATDTYVDFRHSNKQFVTFGSGSITNLLLTFPLVSGNFVCLIKQDGTGSRTITNYKVAEFDESGADGSNVVKFAGGSNPTLTTDANHVDILSFYWDADNEIAYGVATLDFQF